MRGRLLDVAANHNPFRELAPRRIARITFLRNRDPIEDHSYDFLARDLLGFRFVTQKNPVTQHIVSKILHILRYDVAPPLEEGGCFGGKREVDGSARRGTGTNQRY